jgi:hypothetical protein
MFAQLAQLIGQAVIASRRGAINIPVKRIRKPDINPFPTIAPHLDIKGKEYIQHINKLLR